MSEVSNLLDLASIKLEEAILDLQEMQERLRMSRVNLQKIRESLGSENETTKVLPYFLRPGYPRA